MDPKIRESVKNVDGFFASYLHSQISPYFVMLFSKLKIRPNFITILSLIIAIISAAYFIKQDFIVGAILIQAAFLFDCVDGQLARYLNLRSKFGAWLDTITDRFKEFLILFAIALGYFFQTQIYGVFILAFLTILVTALRHYDFSARHELGIFQDRREEKNQQLTKIARFRAILKESLLFGISERWAIMTICLIFNQIILMYYILIITETVVTIFKSFYSWKNFNRVKPLH